MSRDTITQVIYTAPVHAPDKDGEYRVLTHCCDVDAAADGSGVDILELWPRDTNWHVLKHACFSIPMADVPALIEALHKAYAGPLGRLALDAEAKKV